MRRENVGRERRRDPTTALQALLYQLYQLLLPQPGPLRRHADGSFFEDNPTQRRIQHLEGGIACSKFLLEVRLDVKEIFQTGI